MSWRASSGGLLAQACSTPLCSSAWRGCRSALHGRSCPHSWRAAFLPLVRARASAYRARRRTRASAGAASRLHPGAAHRATSATDGFWSAQAAEDCTFALAQRASAALEKYVASVRRCAPCRGCCGWATTGSGRPAEAVSAANVRSSVCAARTQRARAKERPSRLLVLHAASLCVDKIYNSPSRRGGS